MLSNNRKHFVGATVVGAILAAGLSQSANANSTYVTGTASPLTAAANLDFTITIPKFLYLRVGTGLNLASLATIDNIIFTVPAANIGSGTPVTGVGGDLTAGQVTARVIGNNGAISFSSTTLGPLNDGAGDTISYAQLGVAVAANTSTPVLPHPAFVDGGTTTITLPTQTGGKVTNLDAKWTFTYLNTAIVPAGTYGGVNTQNGRVTYAVSMP